jgi:hypothetical protein
MMTRLTNGSKIGQETEKIKKRGIPAEFVNLPYKRLADRQQPVLCYAT